MRRLIAISKKEFIHIYRDARSLVMAIGIPIVMILLYGYALTLDVDNVPLIVWDQSRTPASREYISNYKLSRYFQLGEYAEQYHDIEAAIDGRRAMMGLVIPVDFAARINTGRPVTVQAIVDGSDATTATIALGYANGLNQLFSQKILMNQVRRLGSRKLTPPVDVRARVWFNPDMESKNYIIPGLIAVIMMVISALLTSLTVAGEWERGTMEQLISTPVKGHELILGKLLPYFVIGMTDMLVAVLLGQFVFDVPMRGSFILLFIMAAIFLAGALAIGITFSVIAKKQVVASQLALMLTYLPAFLLSGFMFPIVNMPKPIQVITHIIPARYFIALIKGIYLKGIGLEVLCTEAVFLVIFSCLMVRISIKKFKKKLA